MQELELLKKNWTWLMALGVCLVVIGMLAIGAAYIVTDAVMVVFGVFLLLGGGIEISSSAWARRWSGFFIHILAGVLYLIVGFLMVVHPTEFATLYTLLMAIFFMVGGLFRIIMALVHQFHHWGYTLANGIVTLLLGILIYRQWPLSGHWVIGLFVGIEMLIAGWTWIMLAMAVKQAPPEQGAPVA